MTDRVLLSTPTTLDEFERYIAQPENMGRKLQLINGEIVEEMPKIIHARIMRLLMKWLERHMDAYPDGEILPEIRIDLPDDPNNARVADIGVVVARAVELAKLGDHDALTFMPDLIVEIQSEGQTDRYMRDLADFYIANGCQMVWLIYPDRKLVEWLTSTERRLLNVDGVISGGSVLPEFSLAVSSLFS
jgi:Uma2 family endonuclease